MIARLVVLCGLLLVVVTVVTAVQARRGQPASMAGARESLCVGAPSDGARSGPCVDGTIASRAPSGLDRARPASRAEPGPKQALRDSLPARPSERVAPATVAGGSQHTADTPSPTMPTAPIPSAVPEDGPTPPPGEPSGPAQVPGPEPVTVAEASPAPAPPSASTPSRSSATTAASEPSSGVSQSQAPASIAWGAWIGEQLTGTQAPWDMSAVTKFEQMTGKPMSLIQFSSPFADCSSPPCSFYRFSADQMQRIREHGSIPFFSWASQSTPASGEEPEFQLADVLAGNYDSYIRQFAEEARKWGHPFFLRFNWEMNGNWFEWSEGVNGNQAGEYVAVWRHVHDIFAEVGATNATWVWCPNVDPGETMHDLASLYPGDAYVDWTGLDGYNWGPAGGGWASFRQLYAATYRRITGEIAPSKPMVIGEMGSTESGGSKAGWIEEALSSVPTEYPKVRALLWFEKYEEGMDWPIESSASATSAFAAGIQNPAYAGDSYGSLSASPIPAAG